MDPRATPLHAILRLNSRLLLNCFEGMDETTARQRPNARTNSAAFLACHLIDSRHYLLSLLGRLGENPVARFVGSARSIDDVGALPPLADVRAAWRSVSTTLEACLAELSDAELTAPSPQRFPVEDRSLLGAVAFLLQHESYHVGQLALIRKYFGLPAMSWRTTVPG